MKPIVIPASRTLILVFLLSVSGLFMSGFQATSAEAIFGLSTCEKVKKQIQTLESTFNKKQGKWAKYQNSMLPIGLERNYLNYISVNQVQNIWKVAYNNPKCFTRSQNLQIKTLRNLQMEDFIEDMPKLEIRKDEPKCKNLTFQLENLDFCKLRRGIYIGNVYSMDTIYKF